jgi:hypothetical protein
MLASVPCASLGSIHIEQATGDHDACGLAVRSSQWYPERNHHGTRVRATLSCCCASRRRLVSCAEASTVNVVEILLNLAPGCPAREVCARELRALLLEFSGYALLEPLSRQYYCIPPQDRDEIVARVTLKVLERSPLEIAKKGEAPSRTYLKTMLVRSFLTYKRKAARLVLVGESLGQMYDATSTSTQSHRDDLEEVARVFDLLDRAFAYEIERRAERYRAGPRLAWQQLKELLLDQASMREILERDEGLSASASEAELKTSRDRVQQRHKRLRTSLAVAIDQMEEAGWLTEPDAATARGGLPMLLRCHRAADEEERRDDEE